MRKSTEVALWERPVYILWKFRFGIFLFDQGQRKHQDGYMFEALVWQKRHQISCTRQIPIRGAGDPGLICAKTQTLVRHSLNPKWSPVSPRGHVGGPLTIEALLHLLHQDLLYRCKAPRTEPDIPKLLVSMATIILLE